MNITEKIENYLDKRGGVVGGNTLPKDDKTKDTCKRCGVAMPKKDLKKHKNKMLCPDCIKKDNG